MNACEKMCRVITSQFFSVSRKVPAHRLKFCSPRCLECTNGALLRTILHYNVESFNDTFVCEHTLTFASMITIRCRFCVVRAAIPFWLLHHMKRFPTMCFQSLLRFTAQKEGKFMKECFHWMTFFWWLLRQLCYCRAESWKFLSIAEPMAVSEKDDTLYCTVQMQLPLI